jgi:hypothetical protein
MEIDLPTHINIDNELSKLRILIQEKENIKKNYRGKLDYNDIIELDEYKQIFNKEDLIENKIKGKLWETMIKYCERGDFEGAKWFVGKSYKDVITSGKTLLFRAILIYQDKAKNEKYERIKRQK